MPIYDYHCSACGAKTSELQKLSDPELVRCPVCGKDALKREVSAPAFQLKGSGWYVTDFKNSAPAKPPSESSAKSPPTPTPPSAKKD